MDQALADIGVISAYRFVDDGSATKLDVANLDAELADPQGWLWLHFNLSNRRCHDWLAKTAPLSDVARETLLIPTSISASISSATRSPAFCPTCIRSSCRRVTISYGCTLRSHRS